MSDEYSDQQLQDILATVDRWNEEFETSPEFLGLIEAQQRKVGAVIEFFAQYSYSHLGVPPERWDHACVVECCTEILPRKVSAETAFFEAIPPVLAAFFEFLANKSLIRKGRELAKVVAQLDEEIVANSKDRNHWGLAKTFVMAAHEAGVDIHDEAALQAFCLEMNLRTAARSASASPQAVASPFNGATPQPNAVVPDPPVDRHGPCPCGSGKKYKFCCELRASR